MEYEARFEFSKVQLLEDFDKFYPMMNEMALEFDKDDKVTQVMDLWKSEISENFRFW